MCRCSRPARRRFACCTCRTCTCAPRQTAKQEWLRDLGRLVPDLVVLTGDVLSHRDGGAVRAEALEPLLGARGSSFRATTTSTSRTPKNPVRYVFGTRTDPKGRHRLAWLCARICPSAGWQDLTNVRIDLKARRARHRRPRGRRSLPGRDRMADVGGPADPWADLRLGMLARPEPRVSTPNRRRGRSAARRSHARRAGAAFPASARSSPTAASTAAEPRALPYGRVGNSWLHVSPGLGTSPYAPIRFACRPEATLLTLTALA